MTGLGCFCPNLHSSWPSNPTLPSPCNPANPVLGRAMGQETPGISSHISTVTLTSLNLSSSTSVLSLHKPFGKEISWLIPVFTVTMSPSGIGMRAGFQVDFQPTLQNMVWNSLVNASLCSGAHRYLTSLQRSPGR